jgi:CheY-like chemotaxis protein
VRTRRSLPISAGESPPGCLHVAGTILRSRRERACHVYCRSQRPPLRTRLEQVDRAKAAHGVLARKRRVSRFCQFLTNCRPPGHDGHMPDSPGQLKRFLLARPLQGATVLVVDDHEDSRNVLRQMVEWFGARVHTARNGHGALAWLDKQTPDLLLLDLRMPGMDGFTVFQRLRADPRFSKLRAIAVTALGSDDDVMRTWEAGFDGHLVKPIDFETLALALNRAFWAHSGQVRFSVGRMPARARRLPVHNSPRVRRSTSQASSINQVPGTTSLRRLTTDQAGACRRRAERRLP